MDKPPSGTPRPFWTWDWRTSSAYERAYLAYRLSVRPLLALAAIIGAVLVVVDAYPRAMNTLLWRQHQYGILRQIHAGYDLDFAQDLLGVPTQSQALGQTADREFTYVRRDHYVQIVADAADRIVLYSVTSCDVDFQPSFSIGSGTLVATLQDRPLADTPVREGGGDGPDDRWLFSETARQLGYQPGATGSTPEMYWESTGPGSTASTFRSWFVGVNPLCVSDGQLPELPRDRHFGPASLATEAIQQFRHRFSANLYAEVVDLNPAINEMGQIMLPPPGAYDADCLGRFEAPIPGCGSVTVGVFSFGLALHPDGKTRVHP